MYNPFSVLNALMKRAFGSYWFGSGTPTFLVNMLKKTNFDLREMDGIQVGALSLNADMVDTNNLVPLLYQSGYLTTDNNIIREIARLLDAPIMTTTLPYEEHEDLEYMTDPELIDEKFGDIVDLVIDGGIGGIEPSTVVKCTDDELEIIRQGKGWLEEV